MICFYSALVNVHLPDTGVTCAAARFPVGNSWRWWAADHPNLLWLCCREVGLLKINVERAEWDVLAGIAEQDWPKVRMAHAYAPNLYR